MADKLILALAYLWIGFTVGYFFRKWLDGADLPARAERTRRTVGAASARAEGSARRAGAGSGWPAEDSSDAPRGAPDVPPAGFPAGYPGGSQGASGEEQVDWIAEDDRVIATLPRSEIRRRNLLHRVTATFLFHPDGRVFVHRRTDTKDVYPGLYDVCVGGTVTAGEDYDVNAYRELEEELGVRGVPLYALFRHRFADGASNSLARVYGGMHAGPFRFQPEEVAEGDWADAAQVEQLIAGGRLCPDSVQRWRDYQAQVAQGRPFGRVIAGRSPVPPPA
ncbi:MAG: NUDIX domain-containing protein [Candidatus Lambdaproteobacteria bacterium]|nr:NUDIX domain-containing protein [Candidatus Lambdaproteobacteria bacterium]